MLCVNNRRVSARFMAFDDLARFGGLLCMNMF